MVRSRYLSVIFVLIILTSTSGCIEKPHKPKVETYSYETVTDSEQVISENGSKTDWGAGMFSYAYINETYNFNISEPNLTLLVLDLTAVVNGGHTPDNISLTVFPPDGSNATYVPDNPAYSKRNSSLQMNVSLCSDPLNLTRRSDEDLDGFLRSNTCENGIGEWKVQVNIFKQGGCIPWIMEFNWTIEVNATYYHANIK